MSKHTNYLLSTASLMQTVKANVVFFSFFIIALPGLHTTVRMTGKCYLKARQARQLFELSVGVRLLLFFYINFEKSRSMLLREESLFNLGSLKQILFLTTSIIIEYTTTSHKHFPIRAKGTTGLFDGNIDKMDQTQRNWDKNGVLLYSSVRLCKKFTVPKWLQLYSLFF